MKKDKQLKIEHNPVEELTNKLKKLYLPQINQTIKIIQNSGISETTKTIQKLQDEFKIYNNLIKEQSIVYYPKLRPVTSQEVEIIIQNAFKKNSKNKRNNEERETTIYLTKNGRICRKISSDKYHEIQKNSLSSCIIRCLARKKNNDCEQLEIICKLCGNSNNSTIRTTISTLNRKIKNKLNLKNNLIEGRRSYGYRINPLFYIETEE